MDQYIVLHFNVKKGERNYQLMLQPGAPFEEVQEVLELFKADFAELQKQNAERAQQAQQESESVEVEPEVSE
jgi:hypothetical protein